MSYIKQGMFFYMAECLFVRLVEQFMSGFRKELALIGHRQSIHTGFGGNHTASEPLQSRLSENGGREKGLQYSPCCSSTRWSCPGAGWERSGSIYVSLFIFHKHWEVRINTPKSCALIHTEGQGITWHPADTQSKVVLPVWSISWELFSNVVWIDEMYNSVFSQ